MPPFDALMLNPSAWNSAINAEVGKRRGHVCCVGRLPDHGAPGPIQVPLMFQAPDTCSIVVNGQTLPIWPDYKRSVTALKTLHAKSLRAIVMGPMSVPYKCIGAAIIARAASRVQTCRVHLGAGSTESLTTPQLAPPELTRRCFRQRFDELDLARIFVGGDLRFGVYLQLRDQRVRRFRCRRQHHERLHLLSALGAGDADYRAFG